MTKYDPIKRQKLSHEVRDRLIMMIQSGELKKGDKMLSERQIMERFGVGRPSVREALQSIEAMGLISIQHGEKATIKIPTAENILKQIDPITHHLLSLSPHNVEHLKEARQVFEAGVVILATQRATIRDIEKLGEKLIQMRECAGERAKFLKADQEFHTTIAEISGNPIFVAVSNALFKWLSKYRSDLLGVPGLEDLTLKEHEAILDCIAAKDDKMAAIMISDHILRINKLYKEFEKRDQA